MGGPFKMAETIEESLKNGFISWRNNLEIGVPYFLSMVVNVILLIVSLLGVTLTAAAASALTLNMDSTVASLSVLAALCASSLAALALIAGFNAYFSAGAIGMSIEAALKGRTTLSDMAHYGKKRWFDIFKMNMLWTALLVLPGIVLLLPPAYAFYSGAIPQGVALAFIGTAVYLTYAVLSCLMYTITGTVIVVDGSGVMQGARSAYRFSSSNKIKIMLTVFAYVGTMSAAGFAWSVLTSPLGILQFLSPAVYGIAQGLMILVFILIASFMITPLYTIWLTRAYLGRGTKGAKAVHSPASRQETRDRHVTQRDIYVRSP
jgi:hypothetical protein